jgi:hypothetical protein
MKIGAFAPTVVVALGALSLAAHADCTLKTCAGADLTSLQAKVAAAKSTVDDPEAIKVLKAQLIDNGDAIICARDTDLDELTAFRFNASTGVVLPIIKPAYVREICTVIGKN